MSQNHATGLLDDVKIQEIADAEVVDLMGCEGVLFVAVFAAPAGTDKIVLEMGDQSDGSDHVAVNDSRDTSSAAEVTGDGTASVLILECHKPIKRYGRIQLTNAAEMVAIKYGHRKQATTQDAAKAIAAQFVSPHA